MSPLRVHLPTRPFFLFAKIFLLNFLFCSTNTVNRTFTVDYSQNVFLKDGEPFRYISGEIHYFRISSGGREEGIGSIGSDPLLWGERRGDGWYGLLYRSAMVPHLLDRSDLIWAPSFPHPPIALARPTLPSARGGTERGPSVHTVELS